MTATTCVVLDVDDTLYLERDYVASGFKAVGALVERELGLAGYGARCQELFADGRRGRIFDEAFAAAATTPPLGYVLRLVAAYRSHVPAIRLEPDASRCLAALEARGCVLGAITDGPAASQRAKLAALGLVPRIPHVVVTGELGAGFGKPHPRAFELIAAAAGAVPGACVYVADNPAKDFVAPAALGWRTVRVRRPAGLHADAESGADVQLELVDLDGLLAVL